MARPPERKTVPAIPAARAQPSHSEPPPSSHHDSTRPTEWEKRGFDTALDKVKSYREELEAQAEAREAELDSLKRTIGQLTVKVEQKNQELDWYREKYEREDKDRDQRIERLEDALAVKVAEINKPHTEADGAAGAATVINKARNRELLKQVAYFVGLVLLALAQLLGWKLPTKTEPNVSVPDTRPRQAEPGVQH